MFSTSTKKNNDQFQNLTFINEIKIKKPCDNCWANWDITHEHCGPFDDINNLNFIISKNPFPFRFETSPTILTDLSNFLSENLVQKTLKV